MRINYVVLEFTLKILTSDPRPLSLTEMGSEREEEKREELVDFSLLTAGQELENCHPSRGHTHSTHSHTHRSLDTPVQYPTERKTHEVGL
jgi:hypothetical protein